MKKTVIDNGVSLHTTLRGAYLYFYARLEFTKSRANLTIIRDMHTMNCMQGDAWGEVEGGCVPVPPI